MADERDARIEVDDGSFAAFLQQRFAGRPDAEVVVHEGAGHAFENSFHPMFSNPDATAESWRRTLAFLDRTLER